MLKLTDARAMRALAHPVRIALLEALLHAGTLTATQASELIGESPANCAFHLRTLAKYGYVVEAGGGKGRERPWRRAHVELHITTEQEDPGAALAAEELGQFWLDTTLGRARSVLSRRRAWPDEWRHTGLLGESEYIAYMTPDEAREFAAEVDAALPAVRRPAGSPGAAPGRRDAHRDAAAQLPAAAPGRMAGPGRR